MKKLVFKKWVEYLLYFIFTIGFFMMGMFEWDSIIPYLIALLLMIPSMSLLIKYGRDD